ncbi:hypothetical protein TNCV_1683331 [Trichonephila clavipes]|nr:hypothetical protein TNCV_1683331 [Trichonephila clavipes]
MSDIVKMFFEGTPHDDYVIKATVSIWCCVSLVLPKSSDVLENRLWNSLINTPATHLCFSLKSVLCSKSLTRSSEERFLLLHSRSTQVAGVQADITSPSRIVFVLSLMSATLTGMTDFESSTTEKAISIPAFELSGSGYSTKPNRDRGWLCHEFEPRTTKDPPCGAAMHAKSVES